MTDASSMAPGDPLPDDVDLLPTVERLHGCTVAGVSEGVNTNFFVEEPEDRDEKKSRDYPFEGSATVQPDDEEMRRTGIIQSERQVFELAREHFGLDQAGGAA